MNECTHTYLGTPVVLRSDYLYTLAQGYVEVYDPAQGQMQIVPVKDLQPIGRGVTAVVKVDVKKATPAKKEEKKKEEPKKEKKKEEKKKKVVKESRESYASIMRAHGATWAKDQKVENNWEKKAKAEFTKNYDSWLDADDVEKFNNPEFKKRNYSFFEDGARQVLDKKVEKIQKGKSVDIQSDNPSSFSKKSASTMKVEEGDITSRIDSLLNEDSWFSDKKEELKLALNKAYTGMIEFIRDLKRKGIATGRRFFAKKNANDKNVFLYRQADDTVRGNREAFVFNMDELNNYIKLLGLRGLPQTMGKPVVEKKEEKEVDTSINTGFGKGKVASKQVKAPKKLKSGEMVEEKIGEFLSEKKDPDFGKGIKKGAFHKWLGKAEDEPITMEDIKKGLASDDPHVVRMANWARNARKWKHGK